MLEVKVKNFELKVQGLASGKILLQQTIINDDQELSISNLMGLLQKHGLPIASSCKGEGLCQKCIVYTDPQCSLEHCLISCQAGKGDLRNFIHQDIVTIYISYL